MGGAPEFPEMLDEVARARELDQFASAHDAQLGFTLRARSAAWSPGYVQQHAARWVCGGCHSRAHGAARAAQPATAHAGPGVSTPRPRWPKTPRRRHARR
jgi:hypothetical protein